MSKTYSELNDALVPKWVRIAVGLLALMNIAYGVYGYFTTGLLFPSSIGDINMNDNLIVSAAREFTARNLAIGIVLGLVAGKGVPESIAAITIVRALVELQTIINTVITYGFGTALILPLILLVAEVAIIKTMFSVIQKRDKEGFENAQTE